MSDRPAHPYSDSGDLSALVSFSGGFQNVDDAANEFGDLAKRWNNRLILEGFPLSKLYLDGRIAIALVVDIGPCANPGLPRYLDHGPVGRDDTRKHKGGAGGANRRVIFLILANSDSEIIGFIDCGDKHPMLVHSVKAVDGPEPVVPLSLVRFYDISNFQREIGRDSLYKSVLFAFYEGLPRILLREISSGRVIFPASDNDCAGYKIKGCSEIVNSVAYDRGDVLTEHRMPSYEDCVAFASGILVLVGASGIDVRLDQIVEPRFKLLDVLVGPFDL
jgi:hypothetical protein